MSKGSQDSANRVAFASGTWTENGIEYGRCHCGELCSTHDDANSPLAFCGDCGAVTCPDCREHAEHSQ